MYQQQDTHQRCNGAGGAGRSLGHDGAVVPEANGDLGVSGLELERIVTNSEINVHGPRVQLQECSTQVQLRTCEQYRARARHTCLGNGVHVVKAQVRIVLEGGRKRRFIFKRGSNVVDLACQGRDNAPLYVHTNLCQINRERVVGGNHDEARNCFTGTKDLVISPGHFAVHQKSAV